MRFGYTALTVVALMAGQGANAQRRPCSEFTGQTVVPETFEQVVGTLGNVTPKGEYETTARSETRISAASPKARRVISKDVEDRKYFEYDADAGMLRIRSYAFQNRWMDFRSAFLLAHPTGIEANTGDNVAVVVSSSESPAGTYAAQNGYGARVTVQRINRKTDAIFERTRNYNEELFVSTTGGAVASFIGQIKMTPAEAQAMKPQLRIAFVVAPRAPYLVQGQHQPGKVTVQHPFEVDETFRILMADIQCGLLIDGSNRVLGAYATN